MSVPAKDRELIERIVQALPEKLRTDYLRELVYIGSLSENDEMLRLLRVMQILTLLAQQVPERLMDERQKLEQLLEAAKRSVETAATSANHYHEDLDRRLKELPSQIASGIAPEAIVRAINENLRQQFMRTTLPETAELLAGVSREMTSLSAGFVRTADGLGKSYGGVVAQAEKAVMDIEAAIARATITATKAAGKLTETYKRHVWDSLALLCGVALLLGVLFGFLVGTSLERWRHPVPSTPETQQDPPAAPAVAEPPRRR